MDVKSTMNVVFNDLQGSARDIQPALHGALRRVLDSGWYILGEELQRFEEEFASYCTVQHCIGVGSGTEALHLALKACGIGPGDEVITVSHTFIATALAITWTGARPVFVDTKPGSSSPCSSRSRTPARSRSSAGFPSSAGSSGGGA